MCKDCGPDPAEQVIDHSIDHPFTPLAQAIEGGPPDVCTVCLEHISAHPDKYHYFMQQQAKNISTYGHEIRVVFPTAEEPGHVFGYTIGRTAFDYPELLITGPLQPDHIGGLLNTIAEIPDLVTGRVLTTEELNGQLGPYPAKLMTVTDLAAAQMFGVLKLFPEGASALQVLWPDAEGRFPDEDGYDLPVDLQPVYV